MRWKEKSILTKESHWKFQGKDGVSKSKLLFWRKAWSLAEILMKHGRSSTQNTFIQGVWILLKNTVIIYCVACEKLIVAKSEHALYMKIKPWFLQLPCTTESCRISIFFFKSCDKVELLLMMKVVKQVLHVWSVISTAKGA